MKLKLLLAALLLSSAAHAEKLLLNVSYDVTRELYRDINTAFIKEWKATTGELLTINQSHGGSSKQARSVIDGLAADVITMNQVTDIDVLHEKGNLIPKDWRTRLPHNSAPYHSTILFLVRKGNPKNIKGWDDLVRDGIGVVIPNPKTSGNGRYSYLAAWAFALKKNNNDEAAARAFVTKLFKNVPVLDTGGRGATTTFDQNGIGDALLTFESETALILREKPGKYEVVIPSLSIDAEAPVSVVDKVVNKRGTRPQAEAYLQFLYSPAGQAIIARHNFRPRAEQLAAKFPKLDLFDVEQVFGSWPAALKTHFADGGIFDKIYQP